MWNTRQGTDDFDALVDTLVGQLRVDGRSQVDAAVLRQLRAALGRRLRQFGLTTHDLEEVVASALVRFVGAVTGGALDPDRSAAAYLTVVARNSAIDLLRAKKHVERSADWRLASAGAEDETVEALTDAMTAHDVVRPALRKAAAAGEHSVVRVVAEWLDLAAEQGRAPTTREVAAVAGMSHMSVSRALRRFRDLVEQGVPTPPSLT
ncbi:MAG: sigma-70 family RNA polymerase sigma factor [Acidimicrobiales bacterium]